MTLTLSLCELLTFGAWYRPDTGPPAGPHSSPYLLWLGWNLATFCWSWPAAGGQRTGHWLGGHWLACSRDWNIIKLQLNNPNWARGEDSLVVRAKCWHPSIESLAETASIYVDVYPQRRELSWDGYVCYIKVLISSHFLKTMTCTLHFEDSSSTCSRVSVSIWCLFLQ
jgi:hypothetical protein